MGCADRSTPAASRPHWGDRFILYVLVFGLGWLTAETSNRRELASVYAQVESALDAVTKANTRLDAARLCGPEFSPGLPIQPVPKMADTRMPAEVRHAG